VVLTNFYERPFRPSLGANLVAKLFDQPSPGIVSEVQSDVRRAIVTFEPRVNLINVLAEYNDINQELKVQVEYSFLDEDDVLDITIERVR
jgi:phage baseplate assembly protein W